MPAAFATAAAVIAVVLITSDKSVTADSLIPQSQFVQPEWPWQAAVGIAMTLYIVTR